LVSSLLVPELVHPKRWFIQSVALKSDKRALHRPRTLGGAAKVYGDVRSAVVLTSSFDCREVREQGAANLTGSTVAPKRSTKSQTGQRGRKAPSTGEPRKRRACSKEPSTKRVSSKEVPRRGRAIRRPSFVMRQPWQGVLIRLEPWPRRFVGESRRVNEARARSSRPRRRRGRQFSLDTRAIHRSPGEKVCVLRRRRIPLDEEATLTRGNFERQSLSIPRKNRDRRQLRGNPHRAKRDAIKRDTVRRNPIGESREAKA